MTVAKPEGCICGWFRSKPNCPVAHCTCWFDDDGGPYGVPGVVTGNCSVHGGNNG
jgi:hypothetical protein